MDDRTRRVLASAMSLSPDERVQLAAELLSSLDGEPDADAEKSWAAEITLRAERARAGETVGIDSETVHANAHRIIEATGSPSISSSIEPDLGLEARRKAARREVLAHLGESAELTSEEAEQIRREWED
jgi:putative addiction module component (TIGR02574 family)